MTVAKLAEALWCDRNSWDMVNLQPLPRSSPTFDSMVRALREAGTIVQTYFSFGNWYLEVAGRSYSQYLDGLPSVMKKNIPYNFRRLERTGQSRIEVITEEPDLERVMDDYEKVYVASWKIREAYPEFVRGLARTAARNGWLRLGMVYINNEPAASQLWIVHEGVASIYKVAYDERFANLSVGTVLTASLMQHVIDIDKVRVVDYLSGDDTYKRNWMSHRREFWGIQAMNPRSTKGCIQVARHLGGRALKRTVRGLLAGSSRT